MRLGELNYDLGISRLIPAWKNLFSKDYLMPDLLSGITVAFIAIPLSLAIALASGVSPGLGLITAIIAGIVCALFGGTTLAVSGPAAAMSILIADIVEKFGVQSLILICGLAGLMQLGSGILGLGRFGRYVPLPVISGFTAGIGVIILIGQLPRAFGIAPPPESDIFSVLTHLKEYLHAINGTCIFLVALTIGVIHGLPKLFPRIPAILPAVIITSLVVYAFDLSDVPLIGGIPNTLPLPHFPQSTSIPLQDLFFNAVIIYLLASLETLLSSSAVDKLAKGEKHDADQELIGQGMGNIAVSLFGGIPVTGVIARSATNVRAGAKTRRSSIIHSLIILLTIFFAAPLIGAIPIAALAGVLFSVAFSMINYKEFYDLWKTTRPEAVIYAVTFVTIIFVDLLAGVQAGIIVSCLIVLLRATKTHLHITSSSQDGIVRLTLVGALTFLSTAKIADIQKQLNGKNGQTILMDLSNIRNLDLSGASAITDLFHYCRARNINFFIKGLPRRFESLFGLCGGAAILDDWYLVSEHELRNKIGEHAPKSSYGRLVHGFRRFHVQSQHDDKRLFEYINKKQDPHTLFIACSDSRIIPSLITSTDPGELFIIRNVGNYIPHYQPQAQHSEAAAIEFALGNFHITDIVICGHANCGAMKACQSDNIESPSQLTAWINMIRAQLNVDKTPDVNDLARMNVVNQVNNLKLYPIVQEKLSSDNLKIHAWFYDFEQHLIYEWDHQVMDFKSMAAEPILDLAQA
ncbi:C4-dicarboxylic acid transporter DauA [Aquicella siphonis]|uniref:carbonic anhydrase n=1 Tax=Aquicella siphonis TaxID=254247 RepID=A0A5E4PHF9_9COXI|nr:bifunctional SulP family inorganic anion transporter/carbonic anhydrase [Aquicella siphonis]VVC75803.1 C4-dicarboxylic acid transporter DauA [Aquicella siphonis]